MKKILLTILFTFILTLILMYIPNKSNFNNLIIIPLIVLLLNKYILGDWDLNYIYTYKDILYVLIIIFISVITIKLL